MKTEIIKKEFYSPIKNDWVKQSGLDEAVFQKEVSFAVQIFRANSYLQQCDAKSALKAVLNTAQTGLTLNPVLKYAYLVPRYNKASGMLECCLDPSYQGLLKLLTDTGSVKSIQCNLVWAGDDIEVDIASDRKIIKHVPYTFTGKDKGDLVASYSIARLHDDSVHVEMMSAADINEIRDRSESYKAYKNGKVKSAIWATDYPEMCRKTVIKRHWKYLPKSDHSEQFAKAVDLDNIANGYYQKADYNHIGLAESLVENCTLDPDRKEKLIRELHGMEYEHEVQRLINYVSDYQQDPRDNLSSQKQVNHALDTAMAKDNT